MSGDRSRPIKRLPDYWERMAQARARAGWEIGDPTWADIILEAFMNPEEDALLLREQMRE